MKKKTFWFVGMGFEVGVLIGIFVYLGQKWDRQFNTKGWITAGLVVLALLLWFGHLIKVLKNRNIN